MKITLTVILLFITQASLPQSKQSDTLKRTPFDNNKIKNAVRLSNTSEVFSYDSLYIWNDKRSLSEIMDARPGYFINDFGLGGRNNINYNSRDYQTVGIFRDGIQSNDFFYQGFDIQNISINEIDKIEEVSEISSFFYGLNTSGKAINVITKDLFQPLAFSQVRFSQDRSGSLFADAIYNQSISRKVNVQLGITKHSLDGRYENSAFDIWRGRTKFSFYFSPQFNARINFYYNNYERGLNDGLVYSPDKDSLLDPELAQIVSPASEKLKTLYYDLTLTSRLFKNKNSLTKLKLYSSNNYRNIDLSEYLLYGNLVLPFTYNHSIQYAADLQQNFNIALAKNIHSDLLIGGNVYYNLYNSNTYSKFNETNYSVKAKYDLNFNSFFVSGMARYDNIEKTDLYNFGAETKLFVINGNDLNISFYGGINRLKTYLINRWTDVLESGVLSTKYLIDIPRTNYNGGARLNYKSLALSGEIYKHDWDHTYDNGWGGNINLDFVSKHLDLNAVYNYSIDMVFPNFFLKSNVAYKGILFRNKLKLRVGFDMKYYAINNITRQHQIFYDWHYTTEPFPQENQFIADFYVGARIGKANINVTLANIFNSLVYNTYLFPLDDRGGLGNVVSRFTIVWDFLN